MQSKLITSAGALLTNVDGWYAKNQQVIPDEFRQNLKRHRFEASKQREGEYMKVASIPVVIVEKWHNEGFDIQKKTAKEIVARLKAEHLDDFIATEKRV